jgi:DNA-binding CsgD family transcriptional regulator
VVLLDDRAHVSYANRSAAEMLGVEPGVSAPSAAERDPRTEALYRTVRPGPAEDGALHYHPADGRPLELLDAAVEWPNEYSLAARRFRHALFIGDPEHKTGDRIEKFDRLYGFTPAEAKLAWLLVGDLPLAEAAEHLGITLGTARTVLKRILAKTGVRRQASLVRLLLSGPAQLREARERPPPPRSRVGAPRIP